MSNMQTKTIVFTKPNPTRRALAFELGADYPLDPMDTDFIQQVKQITKTRVPMPV